MPIFLKLKTSDARGDRYCHLVNVEHIGSVMPASGNGCLLGGKDLCFLLDISVEAFAEELVDAIVLGDGVWEVDCESRSDETFGPGSVRDNESKEDSIGESGGRFGK